jgi:DNA transformation protein
MTRIEDAVNIGPVLGGELRSAGIETLEQLRALGYLEAWRRVHGANPDRDCASSCLALAGAIQGVRWTTLPAARRAQIAATAREARTRTAA